MSKEDKMNQEIEVLKKRIEVLEAELMKTIKALDKGIGELEAELVLVGGCDHSVNLCSCELQQTLNYLRFGFQSATKVLKGK